jgi:hypothetical protein
MSNNIDLKQFRDGLNALYRAVEEISSQVQAKKNDYTGSIDFTSKQVDNTGLFWNDLSGTKKLVFKNDPNKFYSSEDFDINADKAFQIGGVDVLRNNELGNNITVSNIQQLGTVRNLTTQGDVDIDGVVFWNSKKQQLSIGSKKSHGSFSVSKNNSEFVIDNRENLVVVGTHSATAISLITDDTDRIIITSNGDISIGTKSSNSAKLNLYGKIGIGVSSINPRTSIDISESIGMQGKTIEYSNQEPVYGFYEKGSIVWNSEPVPYKYAGWICIKSGHPGIWKPFGKIED